MCSGDETRCYTQHNHVVHIRDKWAKRVPLCLVLVTIAQLNYEYLKKMALNWHNLLMGMVFLGINNLLTCKYAINDNYNHPP